MSDTSVERTVAPKQLIALVRDASDKREKIASIAGDLGERVKNAVENGHLHRGAFALMVRLNKMEEQKRNDFIRSFGLYTEHCETGLWGGKHTGDIVDLAEESSKRSKATEQAATLKNAEGIKELDHEKHEANQKGKRGRAKASAAKASAEDDEHEALFERGRIAFIDGKPGMIPDDLQGEPKKGERYLEGWSAAQVQRSKEHDEAEFARNPPNGERLPGADAAGSYSITH